MTGAQSRKIHTKPEWAWSLTDQAHKLGIPVFMKEDLVPIIGDENMIQEMPEEFNKVLEVQKSWKDVYKRQVMRPSLRGSGDRWCMVVVSSCREMLG